MKHFLPLMAVLAATSTTPLLAQDMSAFLNPGAMAAQMGLTGHTAAFAAVPRTSLRGVDATALLNSMTAGQARGFETANYISVSPRPLMRPRVLGIASVPSADAGELIEEMVATGPLGGNTAIVTGANTAVISGANTAIIRSSGASSATILHGESPRPTLWQRIFGL